MTALSSTPLTNDGESASPKRLATIRLFSPASIIAVPEATEIFRQLVEKLTVGKIDPGQASKDANEALKKAYNESFK